MRRSSRRPRTTCTRCKPSAASTAWCSSLDETITGFRWDLGGAQKKYNLTPDLSTFGKAMANGFSVAALCGKREIMRLAGTEHTDRERCFVLSLTHGGETSGLAACIASIEAYQQLDTVATLERQGERLRRGIKQAIAVHGLSDHVQINGLPATAAVRHARQRGPA